MKTIHAKQIISYLPKGRYEIKRTSYDSFNFGFEYAKSQWAWFNVLYVCGESIFYFSHIYSQKTGIENKNKTGLRNFLYKKYNCLI